MHDQAWSMPLSHSPSNSLEGCEVAVEVVRVHYLSAGRASNVKQRVPHADAVILASGQDLAAGVGREHSVVDHLPMARGVARGWRLGRRQEARG